MGVRAENGNAAAKFVLRKIGRSRFIAGLSVVHGEQASPWFVPLTNKVIAPPPTPREMCVAFMEHFDGEYDALTGMQLTDSTYQPVGRRTSP